MSVKIEHILKRYNNYPHPKQCGIQCHINSPEGEYPLHRHDYIEIEYITEGEIEQEINGITSTGSTGACYCFTPQDLHRFKVLKPTFIHSICIDYRHAPLVIRQLAANISSPMAGNVNPETLAQLKLWFNTLTELIASDSPYAQEKIISYALLIITCILEHSAAENQKAIRNYHHVNGAVDYINMHYSENIRLDDAAKALYLSPGYLSKLFAKANGISFSDYLTLIRTEKAVIALSETDKSILDIAFECGFNSFPTFSRSFKKLCGCTPSEYRSNARNNGKSDTADK